MKLLVTGGCGYVGESLFNILNINRPELEVINYDNLSRKNYSFLINNNFKQLNARFEQGDLLDTKRLTRLLQGVDVVIHLAGLVTTPFANDTPHLFEQNNHWATSSLLTAIEQSDVKRVIYLSTATVYGSSTLLADESTVPNPETYYCVSKHQAERQFMRIADREVFIIRSGNVYGHNSSMRMDAFINRFLFESHYFNKLKITGNGEQMRPIIHVNKLSKILVDLIDLSIPASTYNLAEHNFSINSVADMIQSIYPALDLVYSSQNMPMRTLQLKAPCPLLSLTNFEDRPFIDELQDMKDQFSFATTY